MAKKSKSKTAQVSRVGNILASAKKGHLYEVGVGGGVFDPKMSFVRGIRLPSLGLMHMLGFSSLRDSCTVLIDGKSGSSKSSLAMDLFNWGLPYAAAGAIIDTENKAAFDIASGMLNTVTLYLPGHLNMYTRICIEEIQATVGEELNRCRLMNGIGKKDEELSRDNHIPFILITDSLAATPSKETKDLVAKQGFIDRGHGGRTEALLWSGWFHTHESNLLDLPVISVFVNHIKERQEQVGARTVSKTINPGGVTQNYATTIHIRCSGERPFISEKVDGISYQNIHLSCVKNSRGPTGLRTVARKCSMRNEDGTTTFWWDWVDVRLSS